MCENHQNIQQCPMPPMPTPRGVHGVLGAAKPLFGQIRTGRRREIYLRRETPGKWDINGIEWDIYGGTHVSY